MKSSFFAVFFVLVTFFSYAQQQMPAPEVDIYEVVSTVDIPMKLTYPARLKASGEVSVVARVTGLLLEKNFKEGDFVNKGDLLYKIEPDIYKAEVDILKNQVNIAAIQSEKAQKDYARAKASYDDKVLSEQDFDNAVSALDIAKANLEFAKSRLLQAEINYRYTTIKAPEAGFLGMEFLNTGNFVTPGTKLINITEVDPVYVEFSMPDKDFKDIEEYFYGKNSINFNLHIGDKKMEKGVVNYRDISIDEKTSSVKFRGEVANKDGRLMPGDFARVTLENIEQKNVAKIPQKAVIQNPMGSIVFVSDNLTVGVRPVVVSGTDDKFFIIKNGLKPGDRVIVNNFFKIKPGMQIREGKIEKGGH